MGESAPPLPELALHDHQTTHVVDLAALTMLARRALPLVWTVPGANPSVLADLEEIEISLIDDETIAHVHGEFLDDPTPTDVITFHHGEILVSADTAAREASARGLPFQRELLLYVIHGLLHLHGHTDAEAAPRAFMHTIQEQLLTQVTDNSAD